MSSGETGFSKSLVVWLILNRQTEEALTILSEEYRVNIPHLKVGLPKRHRKKILGCYQSKNETIAVFNSEIIGNPYVILHEFYHHIRTSIDKQHKGTEKNADKFAAEFLNEYKATSAGFGC